MTTIDLMSAVKTLFFVVPIALVLGFIAAELVAASRGLRR